MLGAMNSQFLVGACIIINTFLFFLPDLPIFIKVGKRKSILPRIFTYPVNKSSVSIPSGEPKEPKCYNTKKFPLPRRGWGRVEGSRQV
jgi:hypothetical protein